MATAWVVSSPEVRDMLQRSLSGDDKAFTIGQERLGYRFDRIVLLCGMTIARNDRKWFKEWLDGFRCCLAPGGKIVYD